VTGGVQILVASENLLFAECVAERLARETQARGSSCGFEELAGEIKRSDPNILVLDSDSWNAVSEKLLARLRSKSPRVRVLVLIARPDEAYAVRLLSSGVAGVVSRAEPFATLLRAFEAVASGRTWAQRRVVAEAITRVQRRARVIGRPLTPRERQILTLLGDGYRNKEIAARLDIKEQTVKIHLYSLFKKLNVRTRVEAALKAAEGGRTERRQH
jgi:DNA-binding NarL/FixJ family response regulator